MKRTIFIFCVLILVATERTIHCEISLDPADYYRVVDGIGNTLEAKAATNSLAAPTIEKHAHAALSKQIPRDPSLAITCLHFKASIAYRLARISSPAPNHQTAESLAKFLGEIRQATITNYQRAATTLNVMPPFPKLSPKKPDEKYVLYFAGMDPKDIPDPEVKKKYEQAIAKNSENKNANSLQLSILPALERKLSPIFTDYLKKLVAANPAEKKRLESFLTLARATERERSSF